MSPRNLAVLLLSFCVGFSSACNCTHQKPEIVLCKSEWAARLHILSRSYWLGRTTYRVESGLFVKKPSNNDEFRTAPRWFDIATEDDCALDDLKVGTEYIVTGKYVADSGFFHFITKHFKKMSGTFVVDRCSQVADIKGHIYEWSRLPRRLERAISNHKINLCEKKNA